MDWLWGRSKKEEEKKDEFIKRAPASRVQRAKEEEAIEFINKMNKQDQGRWVKIAVIKKTLRDATNLMKKNMMTVSERGPVIEDLIDMTDGLQQSSRTFMIEASPWHKRWWYKSVDWLSSNCCCCLFSTKESEKEKGKRGEG